MVHSGNKKHKEQEQEQEDPNSIWDHALPLENTKLWIDKAVEAQFMHDLFVNHLPIGENKEEIDSYFNRLKESIANKEEILTETFPDDYSVIDIDGSTASAPDQYHYFSADLLKQQASKLNTGRLITDSDQSTGEYQRGSQIMEDSSFVVGSDLQVPSVSETDGDHAYMAFGEDDEDSFD